MTFEEFLDATTKATSFSDFVKRLKVRKEAEGAREQIRRTLLIHESARRDFNTVREILRLKPLRLRKAESDAAASDAQPAEKRASGTADEKLPPAAGPGTAS